MAGIGNSVTDDLYLKLAEDKEEKNSLHNHQKKHSAHYTEPRSTTRHMQRTGLEKLQSYENRVHNNFSNYNTSNENPKFGVPRGRTQMRNFTSNSGQSNGNETSGMGKDNVASSSKVLGTRNKAFLKNESYPFRKNEEGTHPEREGSYAKHHRNTKINQARNRSLNRKPPWSRGNAGLEIDNDVGHSNIRRSISSQSINRRSNSSLNVENINKNANRPARWLGYKRLEDLCNETPTDIVSTLLKSDSGFKELVCTDLRPDLLVLVVTVLAKACTCDFGVNKSALLSIALQTQLLESIEKHMSGMPAEESKERKNKMAVFISNLLILFETVMNILPNTASEKFKKLFINTDVMMQGVERYQAINLSEQKEFFNMLMKRLENIIEERETKEIKTRSNVELLSYIPPPDDFREKSVYPSLEDLFGDETPFIRPNIVDGAYLDVDHYLDIQFRLLREDFVSPLRDGLRQLRDISSNSKKRNRIDNVRVYQKVVFGNPKVVNDLIGIVVQFDPEKKLKIKWEYSKRFMFGSLLLFTKDNFKHVMFGTVLGRDMKDLKNGEVIVSLHQEDHGLKIFGSDFIMVESEVYFEPYKHVMRALQGFQECSFPMKEYIISVQKESPPPKYLLLDPYYCYDVEHRQIQVLDENSWPVESALGLDKSQLAAFKAALTEEYVIIQGPPGTGKTYLGLKIAKVLLKNSQFWNVDQTPILVVCYTNHALDQFLEGLMSVTHQIVRFGGQSKSSVLSKYNIREKRRAFHFKNANTYLKREYHSKMSLLMKGIKTKQANLEELQKHKGIVSVQTLKEKKIISNEHVWCFEQQGYSEDNFMQEWLLEGNEEFFVRTEGRPGSTFEVIVNSENEEEEEEAETGLLADMDFMDFDLGDIRHDIKYVVDLQTLEERQKELLSFSHILRRKHQTAESGLLEEVQQEFFILQHLSQYWKSCLAKNYRSSAENIRRLHSVRNLWQLPVEDRWLLYKDWEKKLEKGLRNGIHELEKEYRECAKKHEEMKQICDYDIMRSSLIVGMTTTNAARLQSLLQALKPKIVIVEEAAEVLESHIVVSLTNKCEHVILIGDHQQLRPAPAVYKLAHDFNFDISLFERMVKNGMQCYCLEKQHRMRPEISKLIIPTIYPELKNDISVYHYPTVRGITKSLFFISHDVPEEEVDDIMSHKNSHEADFVLALCRHLIWQGYKPQEITVLTTYKGQMFYMRKKQKNMLSISEVNITVVDNYQGEENKIILLSLVRSNKDAKIGFLRIENRVCVALSRAREGLYIIGNMDNLAKSSKIWPQIKDSLVQQNSYGPHLTLQCQIHTDQQTSVNCAGDFSKVPEGGCSLLCKALLRCGHQCESICHVNNREHTEYKCQKKCERTPEECSFDHSCPKFCYETCGKCETYVQRILPCGHVKNLKCHINYKEYCCVEEVMVELPACGHKVAKPCHRDVSTYPCSFPCNDRLPCGHSCTFKCHVTKDPDHLEYVCKKPCAKQNAGCTNNHMCTKLCYEECGLCFFEVTKKLPNCIHTPKVKCSQDPAEVECRKDCTKTMMCGHKCHRKCFEECGGCQVKVKKIIPSCGHELNVKCSEIPNPSLCKRPCKRLLPCRHGCVRKCGQECLKECHELVRCPVTPLCGHSIEIPCHLQKNIDSKSPLLVKYCRVPCGKTLLCDHKCKGTCGECMQGRIHVPCAEKCDRNIICGHKCKDPCAAACPPCSSQCDYKCKHSKCNRKCGVPCVHCKEPCSWKCEHLQCTKLCSQFCDRKPCYEPCKKKLKCGHDCIGFCGDKCPILCRICDKTDVKEVFLGNEEDDNARFVYLVDCGHTLESEGLETWLQQSDKEITLKTCPRCKTSIMRTERFMNYVKQTFRDISQVKRKLFGEMKQLEQERQRLLKNLTKSLGVVAQNFMTSNSTMYDKMLKMCKDQLQLVRNNRVNFLGQGELQSMKNQIEIFHDLQSSIFTYIVKHGVKLTKEVGQRIFYHFDCILEKVELHHGKLSMQGTADFNRECKRFLLACHLVAIERTPNFAYSRQSNATVRVLYEKAFSIVQSIDIFTDLKNEDLKETIGKLQKAVGSATMISDRERKEIIQAMSLTKGHWFKCPNNHVYCITECGGAMQESKCPDCGEAIGGSNHRLLSTNRLASEMDGAVQPAWPGGVY